MASTDLAQPRSLTPSSDSMWVWLRSLYGFGANANRIESIEGLRGFGMVLVFFGHFEVLFRHLLPANSSTWGLLNYLEIAGHRGVAFFLVITGYFVYGKFLDRPVPYASFVQRRLRKIYPLYLFVLALYVALSFVFPSESKIPPVAADAFVYILQNALLLPGLMQVDPMIVVTWTISYLVLAYLTIPLVVSGLRMHLWRRWQRTAFLLACACVWLSSRLVFPGNNLRPVMLIVGMLVYEALRGSWFFKRMSRTGEVSSVVLMMLSFWLLYLLKYDGLRFLPLIDLLGKPMGIYWSIILGIGLFYICMYCFGYTGRLQQAFAWEPLRCIGAMGYSYYLIHGVTMKGILLLSNVFLPPATQSPLLFWGLLPFAFIATLLSSSLLYLLVERQFRFANEPSASR
jgi:exopolysaccharide production protein ExoZ